jgi:hypothetical protein
MTDAELDALIARDHKRGCPKRYADCTCGYETALEAALPTLRAENARLREALENIMRWEDRMILYFPVEALPAVKAIRAALAEQEKTND